MPTDVPPYPYRRFVFQLHGGPRDGSDIFAIGPPRDDETALAHGLWFLTCGGAMGQRFQLTSANALAEALTKTDDTEIAGAGQRHVYEVVSERESSDQLIIECKYRGAS